MSDETKLNDQQQMSRMLRLDVENAELRAEVEWIKQVKLPARVEQAVKNWKARAEKAESTCAVLRKGLLGIAHMEPADPYEKPRRLARELLATTNPGERVRRDGKVTVKSWVLLNRSLAITFAVCQQFMFGVRFERYEDWEIGDYGQRYGCDVYFDGAICLFCYELRFRLWQYW